MTTTTRTPGPAGPGEATIAELAAHWGVEKRAVAAIARRLGLGKRGSKYLWSAIWAAEQLAPPPPSRWATLKKPLWTVAEAAAAAGVCPHTISRHIAAKPDPEFPDPVVLGAHTRRFRAEQIAAWVQGLPVPTYRRCLRVPSPPPAPRAPQARTAPPPKAPAPRPDDIRDPFRAPSGRR